MREQPREIMVAPEKKRHAQATEPTVRRLQRKLSVLVIADEHLIRIMVQLGLERAGFAVWLASDGGEAINLYRAHYKEVDVLLLDIQVPGLDGFQTLDDLRELNPGVPACFMSGDTGVHKADEPSQRESVYVIAKPFLLTLTRRLWGDRVFLKPESFSRNGRQSQRRPIECPDSFR